MTSSAFLLAKPEPTSALTAHRRKPAPIQTASAAVSEAIAPATEPERRSYVRLPAVRDLTGLPTSTIYRYVKTRQFPQPHALGPRTVGWLQADIDQWLADRQPRVTR